tara:strand:- start:10013 stop:11026 length:1014 start_codon:yes stop_codon:yes gene_type:complete
MTKSYFDRDPYLLENILFIDGTSGSGKSLLSTIISCYEEVELPIWDDISENLSCVFENNEIDFQTFKSLLTTLLEKRLYDSYLGRHTNFRYLDRTSVFHNSNKFLNIKKIFKKDSDKIYEEITSKKILLVLGTHHLLSFPSLVSKVFKDRLKIIEMVRHPVSIIQFWLEQNWVNRMGQDPKEFTLALKYAREDSLGKLKSLSLPWYVKNHEEEFLEMNNIEKVINSLYWIKSSRATGIKKNKDILDKSLISIPFEHFVQNPSQYLNSIELHLNKKIIKRSMKKFLKKEKIPRKVLKKDMINKKENILNKISSDVLKNTFLEMCNNYEKDFYFKLDEE